MRRSARLLAARMAAACRWRGASKRRPALCGANRCARHAARGAKSRLSSQIGRRSAHNLGMLQFPVFASLIASPNTLSS